MRESICLYTEKSNYVAKPQKREKDEKGPRFHTGNQRRYLQIRQPSILTLHASKQHLNTRNRAAHQDDLGTRHFIKQVLYYTLGISACTNQWDQVAEPIMIEMSSATLGSQPGGWLIAGSIVDSSGTISHCQRQKARTVQTICKRILACLQHVRK